MSTDPIAFRSLGQRHPRHVLKTRPWFSWTDACIATHVCGADDSIEGIFDTLKECATISKSAGGIGLNIHDVRATGSYIRGTNGSSNGILPMLRVFNDTARYVDQVCGQHITVSLLPSSASAPEHLLWTSIAR